MYHFFKSNILAPLGTRLGTFVSGGLVFHGVTTAHADVLGTAVAVGLGVGADLGLAWLRKQAIIKQVLTNLGLAS